MNKENPEADSFGLITDEDKKDVSRKLIGTIEERLKNKLLPPDRARTSSPCRSSIGIETMTQDEKENLKDRTER